MAVGQINAAGPWDDRIGAHTLEPTPNAQGQGYFPSLLKMLEISSHKASAA
jgi:hypothetical protein